MSEEAWARSDGFGRGLDNKDSTTRVEWSLSVRRDLVKVMVWDPGTGLEYRTELPLSSARWMVEETQ